jgi:hypothetical protein
LLLIAPYLLLRALHALSPAFAFLVFVVRRPPPHPVPRLAKLADVHRGELARLVFFARVARLGGTGEDCGEDLHLLLR